MSAAVTIKPGDRVIEVADGDPGIVLAMHGKYAFVLLDGNTAPYSFHVDNLTLIPPAPVAVSWRNVYATFASTIEDVCRADADSAADPDRLGVIVGYSDGTYKLEVTP